MLRRLSERLHLTAGAELNQASDVHRVRSRSASPEGLVAAVSRSHFDPQTEAFLTRLPIAAQLPCGSSLKFCHIAEGRVDLYARLAQTCEWDVTAGHAILAAAGGAVTTPDGAQLVYGRTMTSTFQASLGDPRAAEDFINVR